MPDWEPGPHSLSVPDGAVDVWRVDLGAPDSGDEALLDPAERARAARLHFEVDRRAWTTARAALRDVLGRYVARPPGALRFETGAAGRPSLAWPPAGPVFNLSHTRGLALIAVARGGELGVDVERRDPAHVDAGVVESCFTPAEAAAWRTLEGAERLRCFFDVWTRKEAFVKAIGLGLGRELAEIEVTTTAGRAALVGCTGEGHDLAEWSLHDLPVGPEYSGTLAVRARSARLRFFARERRGLP